MEHLRTLNRPAQKSSVTLKDIITGSDYIQVWAIKARWNLKQNGKLKMEEVKTVFCLFLLDHLKVYRPNVILAESTDQCAPGACCQNGIHSSIYRQLNGYDTV